MKLMLYTQYRENYGACDWDGKGECPQYWKNKGGMEYFYLLPDVFLTEELPSLVAKLAAKLQHFSNYTEEMAIDWEVVNNGFLTPFEKDQLEYDGEIKFRPKEVTLEA